MGPEKVRGRWNCYRRRFWPASGESFPTIKGRRAEKEDAGQELWRFGTERGQFGLARSAELTTKWMGIKRKRMQKRIRIERKQNWGAQFWPGSALCLAQWGCPDLSWGLARHPNLSWGHPCSAQH